MKTLALCLIRGHDENHWTLPYALPIRCKNLVTRYEVFDPIAYQESLLVERADSPFLGLYGKEVICYNCEFRYFQILNAERSLDRRYFMNLERGTN